MRGIRYYQSLCLFPSIAMLSTLPKIGVRECHVTFRHSGEPSDKEGLYLGLFLHFPVNDLRCPTVGVRQCLHNLNSETNFTFRVKVSPNGSWAQA